MKLRGKSSTIRRCCTYQTSISKQTLKSHCSQSRACKRPALCKISKIRTPASLIKLAAPSSLGLLNPSPRATRKPTQTGPKTKWRLWTFPCPKPKTGSRSSRAQVASSALSVAKKHQTKSSLLKYPPSTKLINRGRATIN